ARRRGSLRAHARRRLPRLRGEPQLRAARPRQHRRVGVLQPDPLTRRSRDGGGEPDRRARRDGSRRLDRVRDRVHAPPLHLLPAADLGVLLDALAPAEGVHLDETAPPAEPHSASTMNGFPFSTTYVASSAAGPLPTFLTEWTVSAGTISASPAAYVFGGWPSMEYSSSPSST